MLPKSTQNEIIRLANIIDAPNDVLHIFEKPTYDGLYLDADEKLGFILIGQERGRSYIINSTFDIDEYLFWIFDEITHTMALKYARLHNINNRDQRRISFPKHEELLEAINKEWASKVREVHNQLLNSYPFDDENDDITSL